MYDTLKKKYSVEKIYGDTSKAERDMIFNQFNHSVHPKVLVAHPGVMSHGLTLVAASVIVWFSPTLSYETRDQANARIVRPGQKHHTHIIDIISSPIEQRMLKRLLSKQKMQGVLLDMFKEA
jgi:SNF2 family DNA or RNA helicase